MSVFVVGSFLLKQFEFLGVEVVTRGMLLSALLLIGSLWIALGEESTILKGDVDEALVKVKSTASHKYISNTSPTKIGILFDITT